MNLTAALGLKDVKRLIEAGRHDQAFMSANRQLVTVGTHEQAMFYHRAAMAAEKLGDIDTASTYFKLAGQLFANLDWRDATGLAILHRDQAMFEIKSAPYLERNNVAEKWLPIIECDYRALGALPHSTRTVKEMRVTLAFMTRLKWRADPGLTCNKWQLLADYREIAKICQQDGTKTIYVLDGLDEVIRTNGQLSPLLPNAQLRRAAYLSFMIGNPRRAMGYLAVRPAKDSVYATGVGIMQHFDR